MKKGSINVFKGSKAGQVLSTISGQPAESFTSPEALEKAFSEADVPVLDLPLAQLHPCPWQPENRYSQEDVERLKSSVDSLGFFTDPILVRPDPDLPGTYQVLGGNKRVEVARLRNDVTIPGKVFHELDDDVAFEIFAASNLQRTDPSELQETDIVLGFLSIRLGLPIDDVVALIYQACDKRQNSANNVVRKEESEALQALEASFNAISRISLETFRVHRLRWLNMPEDILAAVRQGLLGDSHAKQIGKIKDEEQRLALLQEAIAEELPVSAIAERVKEIQQKPAREQGIPDRMRALYQRVKKSKVWSDPKKRRQIEKLMTSIELLLGDEDAP